MAYTTIDDPSAYFQTQLYTGDASTQDITNSGNSDLQPDWIWIKNRDAESNHIAQDTSRGINICSFPDENADEQTNSNFGHVNSVTSDGFQVDEGNSGEANANKNTEKYVAWQWKANAGTTSSNSTGDITSTVQVSSTAGFSIVTYTATATAGDTVGHGLSSQPEMIMVKKRAGGDDYGWGVWHTGLSNNNGTKQLILDTNAAEATQDMFNNAIFPSGSATVFATGQNNHTNFPSGATYVAYCFNPVQGYSKFGSFIGNNHDAGSEQSDGTFIYTGFKPAWLLFKRTDSTSNWCLVDSKRLGYNPDIPEFRPNLNNAEGNTTDDILDLVSNGFKIRTTSGDFGGGTGTFVYMAFAESPFVSSKGVPTTAR